MTFLKTNVGVRFGLREVFWRPMMTGPRVLNALQCGHNCLTEWDVDYRNRFGVWPDSDFMAFEFNLVPRISFDSRMRERERRGPKLVIPFADVAEVRTRYANGHLTRKEISSRYGISKTDIARILNGSAYWWCGGGLSAFMEMWK